MEWRIGGALLFIFVCAELSALSDASSLRPAGSRTGAQVAAGYEAYDNSANYYCADDSKTHSVASGDTGACKRMCDKDDSCKFFSLWSTSDGAQWCHTSSACHMKMRSLDARSSPTIYRKVACTWHVMKATSCEHTPRRRIDTRDNVGLPACKDWCHQEPSCRFVNYDASRHTCSLYARCRHPVVAKKHPWVTYRREFDCENGTLQDGKPDSTAQKIVELPATKFNLSEIPPLDTVIDAVFDNTSGILSVVDNDFFGSSSALTDSLTAAITSSGTNFDEGRGESAVLSTAFKEFRARMGVDIEKAVAQLAKSDIHLERRRSKLWSRFLQSNSQLRILFGRAHDQVSAIKGAVAPAYWPPEPPSLLQRGYTGHSSRFWPLDWISDVFHRNKFDRALRTIQQARDAARSVVEMLEADCVPFAQEAVQVVWSKVADIADVLEGSCDRAARDAFAIASLRLDDTCPALRRALDSMTGSREASEDKTRAMADAIKAGVRNLYLACDVMEGAVKLARKYAA